MSIGNCKQCNKIFKKRLSDLCVDCLQKSEDDFHLVYRILQKSGSVGGIAIEELAHESNISVDTIEEYYMEGRLGTASNYLKFQCQACDVLVGALQRKGRFCNACSEKTAVQAGVQIKSKQDIDKKDQAVMLKLEQQEFLNNLKADRASGNMHSRMRRSSSRRGVSRRSR